MEISKHKISASERDRIKKILIARTEEVNALQRKWLDEDEVEDENYLDVVLPDTTVTATSDKSEFLAFKKLLHGKLNLPVPGNEELKKPFSTALKKVVEAKFGTADE